MRTGLVPPVCPSLWLADGHRLPMSSRCLLFMQICFEIFLFFFKLRTPVILG